MRSKILISIPSTLRDELLDTYENIERNYRERRWEPSELNGGKLCEVVYSILNGYVAGAFPSNASKPSNMVDACRALEQAGSSFPRSVKIQIPRMIIALYEIRNNRGVGHVGGDVDPNYMDATCVMQMSKWILAEIVRIFHMITVDDAAVIVNSITNREMELIWKVNDRFRVLAPKMKMREKVLVLLYSSIQGMSVSDLFKSCEHSNYSVFKNLLKKAHTDALIDYDQKSGICILSTLGSRLVEDEVLAKT